MSKCGKGYMPKCEYFVTSGCISLFNCPYKIEEYSDNTAYSGGSNTNTCKILLPKVTAVIKIGSFNIQIYDKKFTDEQIKNMQDYFGWDVENIEEKQ